MATRLLTFEECGHPPESIEDGPRYPLRWGSAPTQVCTQCGAYRLTDRWATPWEPGPMVIDEDDEI